MTDGTEKHMKAAQPQLERLATLGELFSEVAHEINNLMQGIGGYAQLESLRSDLPIETVARLEKIHELAELAGAQAKSVLRFSRSDNLEARATLETTVRSVFDLFQYRARHSSRLLWEPFGALPSVAMDAGNLQLVLTNLVKNAFNASEPSGGQVMLRIGAERIGGNVQVTVWNSGPHIPAAVLPRLFVESFVTTNAVGQGTGLGLTVARRLVEQAGGTIRAENVTDGVRFTIVLPVAEEPRNVQPLRMPLPKAKLAGLDILVVDDDAAVQDVLRLIITEVGGGKARSCLSGPEALDVLTRENFDAILLDYRMAGFTGKDVFERLPPPLRGKVIFVTGDVCDSTLSAFISETGRPLLTKPLRYKELIAAILDMPRRAS